MCALIVGALGCGAQTNREQAAATACAKIAQARCSRLTDCASVQVQLRYGDLATCLAQEQQTCENGLAAPATGNSATHTTSCALAIPTWSCSDYLDGASPPAACQQQTGQLAEGAVCAFAAQCQTGFCAVAPGTACGACAAAPVVGSPCTALTTCGPGLTCAAATKQCAAFAAVNGACDPATPCAAGLSCVGVDATTGARGTCKAAATQAGASCDPTLKTGAGCDRNAGLVCNSQSKLCATATVSPLGGACGTINHQAALCAAGTCVGASGATPGTCVADAADGGACDTATGPGCLSGARCIVDGDGTAGTCETNDALSCR